MLTPQLVLGLAPKLVVDIFAGGGGWSTAYEQATGQHVHIAINHNPDALSMHEANHPQARHYIADVWEVCPRQATGGMPVGWLHLSPDCTDHSQAKGGQPRRKNIRALAWVTVRWAGTVKPDIISLENVVQILKWGRLIAKRDPATGRVVKLDGTVAEPGERVPVQDQYLVPDPKQQGKHWRRLVAILRSMGYIVDWRELNAADFGAGTTRTRLFMMARRDGQPISWPTATHFKKPAKGQKRWRAAADGIDWSIEGRSIFGRSRPLADATMRRIARGMKRYVLDSADPFIVPIANWSRDGSHSSQQPISTVTAKPRGGSHAVVAPVLAGVGGRAGQSEPRPASEPHYTITRKGDSAVVAPVLVQAGYGEREGQAPRSLDHQQPLGTVVEGGIKHALASGYLVQAGHGEGTPGRSRRWGSGCNDAGDPVGALTASSVSHQVCAAMMVQANGGYNTTPAHDLRRAASTITNSGSQQQLITAHLTAMSQNVVGSDLRDPAQTVLAGAARYGLLEYDLSPDDEAGALQVAAFLMRYYGEGGQWGDLRDPASTLTTRDRLALVTVYIQGNPYVVVDIRLRMLTPAELYDLQGFPKSYIIDRGHDGRIFTKSQQVHMVGNSVSPPPAMALIAANAPRELLMRKAA
ncbi:DNA cytosine methyltransferase [Bordetella petrii]|uniref:DNA cytosine methyltransferase n=1 Tax=Bordetella petrii TaxID=94624 RepID=UPI00047927D1|nr:DNA cytosine methyltransferase [Bordetella petrii]